MANEDQKTIVNNEEEFKEWLEKQPYKETGKTYSHDTCKFYGISINDLSEMFLPEDSPYKNIFNIDNVGEFLEIRTEVEDNPGYEGFNEKPEKYLQGTPSAALDAYEKFLRSRDNVAEDSPLPYGFFKSEARKHTTFDNEAGKFYRKFQDQGIYSYGTLEKLSGKAILDNIFFLGNKDKDTESLLHALEYNGDYDKFGGIGGGFVSKYGLFYATEGKKGQWKFKQGKTKPKSVSDDEAIQIGGTIRDALVKGAEIIAKWKDNPDTPLVTTEDYGSMFKELNDNIPGYMQKQWFLKYYHMSFPDIFPPYYSKKWQDHILCSLHIMPEEDLFVRIAQIACYIKKCGISSAMFHEIAADKFKNPKTFYRIGTGEGKKTFFDEWHSDGYVAIGWKKLGNLDDIYIKEASKEGIREKIRAGLKKMGYDDRTASIKYGEINRFYKETREQSCVPYVVAMKGSRVYGIGEITGDYKYKEDKEYAHSLPVRWEITFDKENYGPMIVEGRNTSFSEIKKTENIFRLYTMLHGSIKPDYPRNFIFFGAPGTGKSYELNRKKNTLLNGDDTRCTRVTFHPDYSYAHFVGTYKPVVPDEGPKKDEITYEYVPGPFMETYVEARNHPDKEYVLIIEEINRANVAAVFGDVFQLLDRKDGVSEYPVKASKDIQKYLKEKLNDKSPGYRKKYCENIIIPKNMYIWATMNSADQGVFPMDTAFKRRWEFEYLEINHGEEVMKDAEVPVYYEGKPLKWNELRRTINGLLASEGIHVNEDKQLGAFFINKEIIDNAMEDDGTFIETFKNKVLMYLFEDAAKHKRGELFGSKTIRYSEVCANFEKNGLGVFMGGLEEYRKVKENIKKTAGPAKEPVQEQTADPNIPTGDKD